MTHWTAKLEHRRGLQAENASQASLVLEFCLGLVPGRGGRGGSVEPRSQRGIRFGVVVLYLR